MLGLLGSVALVAQVPVIPDDEPRAEHDAGRGLPAWLTLSMEAIYEISSVASGGIQQSTSSRNLVAFNAEAGLFGSVRDSGESGTFAFAQFLSAPPVEGGTLDVGDAQVLSNIETDRSFQHFMEVWVEHVWSGGERLKVGKFDVNTEFAFLDAGLLFTHSSAGVSPTNFAQPTYPEGATGAALFGAVPVGAGGEVSVTYAGGVFDGAFGADGVSTGRRGPSTLFSSRLSDDLYAIGELGLDWGSGYGHLGGWFHTGEFERFTGGLEKGTAGVYLEAEQSIGWSFGGRTRLFGQFGLADERVSAFGAHVGLGVNVEEPITGRERDAAGLYVSWVDLTSASDPGVVTADETAVDLVYRAWLDERVWVQPELQFVQHPGGRDDLDDAWVFFLRVGLFL